MKRTILSIVVLMAAISAMAQTWKVVKTDGSVVRFPASSVNYVTVEADYEYVDLGLPSGTLWATMNVGATSPEEYGDYFAWGEIEGYNSGKTTFNWSTYQWCTGSYKKLTKYCNNSGYGNNGFTDTLVELELSDDAAYMNWGAAWCMPSGEQCEELINDSYTITEMTTQNNVYGCKITSKTNGNSIFLPAAGCRSDESLYGVRSFGNYWSCTLGSLLPQWAWCLSFRDDYVKTTHNDDGRCGGRSIRPVRNQ